MLRKLLHTADSEDDGKRLCDILKQRFGVSEMLLHRIKRNPQGLLLNGKPVFTIATVNAGDYMEIILEERERASEGIVPVEGNLDIRFENEDILILNKPADIAVHPSHGHFTTSLGNIVVWHYKNLGENFVFRPINRLDRGVSGLMAVAKNAYSHTYCARLLHTGAFLREYLAVVHGEVAEDFGTINASIARKPGSVIERMVSPDGDSAITEFSVLERRNNMSLVRVLPMTGRTHQIRVHMAHMGHPIIGDFLYGEEDARLPGRCALHSHRIRLELPFNMGTADISQELSSELSEIFYGNA